MPEVRAFTTVVDGEGPRSGSVLTSRPSPSGRDPGTAGRTSLGTIDDFPK